MVLSLSRFNDVKNLRFFSEFLTHLCSVDGNNPKGQFCKNGLSVAAPDFDGVALAHGAQPNLIGQKHLDVKDPKDKYFVKEFIEVAKTKGSGTVEFVFTNPATKKVQPKTQYVKRVEGMDIMIQCGVYH